MEHTLKGRLIANTLHTGTYQESPLQLTIVGNLTLTDLIDKMKEEDTGLRRETIEHVVSLYHRVVEDAVLNGYHINTGLYCAQPQARGYIVNNAWNPEKNTHPRLPYPWQGTTPSCHADARRHPGGRI